MMELLIGIPMALIGIVLWIMLAVMVIDYTINKTNSTLSLALGIAGFFLCLGGFPFLWALITFLSITYPAILLFPLGMGLTAGATYIGNEYRPQPEEPKSLEYYTKLKRQDAAQAVADWNARAEELLTASGVKCACQTTVKVYYTYHEGRTTEKHRRLSHDCSLHTWQDLELAKSHKH